MTKDIYKEHAASIYGAALEPGWQPDDSYVDVKPEPHPSEYKTTDQVCPKCGRQHVEVREWESSDGGHEDYHYRCCDCGHSWWVDGTDS